MKTNKNTMLPIQKALKSKTFNIKFIYTKKFEQSFKF